MGVSEVEESCARLRAALHVGPSFSLLDLVEIAIFRLQGYALESYELERNLALALGYPLGEKEGPCPGEPVTGDHTVVTLAMQLTARIGYTNWILVDDQR
jgi:hypothetical protein